MSRTLLSLLALSSLLPAQSPNWFALDGHYLADAPPSDAYNLLLLLRPRTAAAQPSQTQLNLAQLFFRAIDARNTNAAARLGARLLTSYSNAPLSPSLDALASLQFAVEPRIAPPGAPVHARLDIAFSLEAPFASPLSLQLALLDPAGKPIHLPAPRKLDSLEPLEFRIPTANLPDGLYSVRLTIDNTTVTRPLTISASLPARIAKLQALAAKLAPQSPRQALAAESVRNLTELYAAALRQPAGSYHQSLSPLLSSFLKPSAYSTDPIDEARDLPFLESLANSLLSGADPLAQARGLLHLARPNSLRLFIPDNPSALLVFFHAETGDDGSPFSPHLLQLAAQRGYIVLAPYAGTPFFDTFQSAQPLIDLIRDAWRIPPDRTFFAAHSMAVHAALRLALASPPAAQTAFHAASWAQLDLSSAPDVPTLLIQSPTDELVPSPDARRFGFLLQRRFKRFDYEELPSPSHYDLSPSALTRAFDFFDQVRAGAYKPSPKPIPLPQDPRTK